MILEQETFDKYGYFSNNLTYGSGRKIIVKCDYCGDIIHKKFQDYIMGRKIIKKDSCKNCSEIKNLESKLLTNKIISKSRKPANIGDKFNYLTIIGETKYIPDKFGKNNPIVKCQCECGNISEFKLKIIKSGYRKSCGCKSKINRIQSLIKHGESKNKLYFVHKSMKRRCQNPIDSGYKNYGQKGIKVCDEWLNFLDFKKWAISSGYKEGLTIERINPDYDYCPQNCEWITKSENCKRVVLFRLKIIKDLKEENLRLKLILNKNNIIY